MFQAQVLVSLAIVWCSEHRERELSLSQCCCFLPAQSFILNPLRGLFATKRKLLSNFYSLQLCLFLLLALHMQTRICAQRGPPLSMGPSVQQQEKHSSPSNTSVSEGQQVNCKDRLGVKAQGLLLLLLCVWEFLVVSQRNKVGATTRPLLLLCDSVGSVASLSKSSLLFLSICLMQHWLVLTAFFKNVLKYSVMHGNTCSKESPDCTHYCRW